MLELKKPINTAVSVWTGVHKSTDYSLWEATRKLKRSLQHVYLPSIINQMENDPE